MYEPDHDQRSRGGCERTKMLQTIAISNAVGTTWNTIEDRRKLMPLTKMYERRLGGAPCMSNRLCTTINCAGETTCLSGEMEGQIEIQEMLKGLVCDPSDSALSDIRKDCIPQLRKERRPDSRKGI